MVCKKEPPHYWAEVAVSPNGKALALVDRGGNIWGGSVDFKVCPLFNANADNSVGCCFISRNVRRNLTSNQPPRFSKCSGMYLLMHVLHVLTYVMFRGGKDFFVIVMEKLMFVKGTGKHWCKYPQNTDTHSPL